MASIPSSAVPPAAAPGRSDAGPSPAAAAARLDSLRTRARSPGEAALFFWDAHFDRAAVKILPGEYFVHDEDILLTTTLGSCIAACLWDRERRVGGMNHFLLPDAGAGASGASGRYGAYAMDLLIGRLVQRGATRATLEAKVFGGGAVLRGMDSIDIGRQNTEFVLHYLREERIAVVSQDVLDVHPRKVCFMPASGKALVKRLPSTRVKSLAAQERAAVARVGAAGGGSVDLFAMPPQDDTPQRRQGPR